MEEWLRSIGLGERIATFRAQSIASDQLAELTESDLRELGLTIGERKRFQRALADLGGQPPEPSRAERRPLTMMFVDMVGSSRISEQLDPEDQMQLLEAYRGFCNGVIERFGGHIARVVGDGVLAYFCYPVANENDPERAVRAALQIARDAGGVPSPANAPIQVRIGVATGRVIVSDLFAGGREADRDSIIGATPNLAARLQSLAPPGGVVVADETHARVRHLFACADLGVCDLHGFDAAHRAWQVTGDLPPHARTFLQPRPRRLTPFFGRGPEQARVAERWEQAKAGRGGAALLIGEAGVGKSRLVEDFLARAVPEGGGIVQLAASAFDQDSALHPVSAFLRAAGGLAAEDPPHVRRAKLAAILYGDAAERTRALPVLARMLDIPAPEGEPYEALTPEQLRERTLSVAVDQMCVRAEHRPLCVVVEDLHWLDPTSRELLARMVERSASLPMLVLATARDGFDAPWLAERNVSVLRLVRLDADAVAGMVESLFAGQLVPPEIVRLIARKTDGVPLFVEEVARSLLQAQDSHGRLPELGGLDEPDAAIPASLHEALMARLDRSGSAKQVAQVAAVAGRQVRRRVLAAVSGLPAAELDQALDRLTASGLLFRDGDAGSETYTFGHALMRDAAYDTLLRDRRRALHLTIARVLPELDSDSVERQPEALAFHLTEGGEADEAAGLWEAAALRGLSRSALSEAASLLRRGLAALKAVAITPERTRLRLRLEALLGPVLTDMHGLGSSEALELYKGAAEACRTLPDDMDHFPIYFGLWLTEPEPSEKRRLAGTLLHRASRYGEPGLMLEAHHCNWVSTFLTGNFDDCCAHYRQGLEICRSGYDFTDQAHAYRSHDTKVCAHAVGAHIAWMRGDLGEAAVHAGAALQRAESSRDVASHVYAWLEGELVRGMWRRDARLVLEHADRTARLAGEHMLRESQARALLFKGWAVAMTTDAAAGLRIIDDAEARLREMTMPVDEAVYACMKAQVLGALGEAAQGEELLAREAERCIGRGLRLWLPELLRTQAEMVAAQGPDRRDEAVRILHASTASSEEQGTRLFTLRTAISSGRLNVHHLGPKHAAETVRTALKTLPDGDPEPDIALARLLIEGWTRGVPLELALAGC